MSEGEKTYTQKDLEIERGHAQKFKQEADELRETLAKFKDIDPNKYQSALSELQELRKKSATSPEAVDELIAKTRGELEQEITGRYDKIVKEKDTKLTSITQRLHELEVVNPALKKAAEAGVNEDMLPIFEVLIKRDAGYDESNNRVFIKGQDGKPRYSEKDPKSFMSIDEYIEGLKNERPSMFKATMKKGGMQDGETSKSYSASSGITMDRFLSMSEAERAKLDPKVRAELSENYFKLN